MLKFFVGRCIKEDCLIGRTNSWGKKPTHRQSGLQRSLAPILIRTYDHNEDQAIHALNDLEAEGHVLELGQVEGAGRWAVGATTAWNNHYVSSNLLAKSVESRNLLNRNTSL